MITFYTAGPFADRDFVQTVADKLIAAGHQVNSRWLSVVEKDRGEEGYEEYMQQQATADLQDCLAADALVYVNTGRLSEGKATELGLAIATLKPIIIIGSRDNNVFLRLTIPCFPDIETAIQWMTEQEAEYNAQQTAKR